MDNYSFGYCYMCGEWKPLRNELCNVCQSQEKTSNKLDKLFGDIFKPNTDEHSN